MLSMGLRKAETADVIASEAAKTPVLAVNAPLASASSFGLSVVLGLAALLALVAAFGGFREKGGPVESGSGYVVGERGPEWFMPHQNGTIIPAAETMRIRAGAAGGASLAVAGTRAHGVAASPVPRACTWRWPSASRVEHDDSHLDGDMVFPKVSRTEHHLGLRVGSWIYHIARPSGWCAMPAAALPLHPSRYRLIVPSGS